MTAFLVDGDLEQKFIQLICPGKKVLKIGCNGKTVKSEAIAKRIKTLIRTMQDNTPVIVCIDLESRKMSAVEFENELIAELKAIEVNMATLVITVIDQMIENWILADEEATGLSRKASQADGFGGKGRIKAQLPHYHETTQGVEFLKKVRPSVAKLYSPSFFRFFSASQAQLKDCWWMQR